MTLLNKLYGYQITQSLYVATKLKIADHLKLSPLTSQELAKKTHCHADALYRMMRCLSSFGIFCENSDGTFSLNEESQQLVSDNENSLTDYILLCGEELYKNAANLLHSIKTGETAFDDMYGMPAWTYLEKNPDRAKLFNNSMEKASYLVNHEILKQFDFLSSQSIVDVGGGKGHLLSAILQAHPHCTGIIYDLSHVYEAAKNMIETNGLISRCQVQSGDFFQFIPSQGDIYLLKAVLHNWDDENAIKILKNCHNAMKEGSQLIIIDRLIQDNQHKQLVCQIDIHMLLVLTGKERTLADYTNLLNAAGFNILGITLTNTSFSMIKCAPIK